jgi:tetratricopeptide (TPR) repeat protein
MPSKPPRRQAGCPGKTAAWARRLEGAIRAVVNVGTSDNAGSLRQAALARQAEGRLGEARALFERAIAAAPTDPDNWVALAGCLLVDRRPEAALQVCDTGLVRLGDSAALLCAKARVLQSLSRVAEATAAYSAALAADPASPEARFGLALQAAEAGEWDVAADLLAPLPPGPGVDWLGARIALGRDEFEAARVSAERALRSASTPDQQAESALLLGEALDGLGRPADAFAAFARGKGALRGFYAERARGRESEVAKLRRLADWFKAADPAPWGAAPPAGTDFGVCGHVFLVGFPRSGTTLLEQALAGHPGLVALEEAPTLAAAYDALMASNDALRRLAHLTPAEAEHWRADYWRAVAAHGADPRRRVFLDKAPAGTLYLPLIAKLFPQAKVLFALRDPRDVVLSCFRSSFQMNALTYAFTDLAETARCYAACMRLADVYQRILPTQRFEVRYERLVDDFEGELGRIATHLGLAPTAAMADVAATARSRVVRTPSAPQVRAGLNRQGLGRWRGYAAELAPTQPILAPWVARFGYEAG